MEDHKVKLHLTKNQAQKLFGMVALCFNNHEQYNISKTTVIDVLPIYEALAVQLDRMSGMNPVLDMVTKEALIVGDFKDENIG